MFHLKLLFHFELKLHKHFLKVFTQPAITEDIFKCFSSTLEGFTSAHCNLRCYLRVNHTHHVEIQAVTRQRRSARTVMATSFTVNRDGRVLPWSAILYEARFLSVRLHASCFKWSKAIFFNRVKKEHTIDLC